MSSMIPALHYPLPSFDLLTAERENRAFGIDLSTLNHSCLIMFSPFSNTSLLVPRKLPEFVALQVDTTVLKGERAGTRYSKGDSFAVEKEIEIDEITFFVVYDSEGIKLYLPAVILDPIDRCPWAIDTVAV